MQCRNMQRSKWRSQTAVNRRVEIAFGKDDFDQKMPSLLNVTSHDPPPLNHCGTKRKAWTGVLDAVGSYDWNRCVIARHVRRKRKDSS